MALHVDVERQQPAGQGLFGAFLLAQILRRRGDLVEEIRTFHKLDTMQLTGWVVAAIEESQPAMVYVDEIGVGAGVVDRLTYRSAEHVKVIAGVEQQIAQAIEAERRPVMAIEDLESARCWTVEPRQDL